MNSIFRMALPAICPSASMLLASSASATTIGVSMQSFDNNFQTLLRQGVTAQATRTGVTVQLEDAQTDALASMAAGDLSVTVFQNAKARAAGAVEATLALTQHKPVDRKVMVPFELVTPENMAHYAGKN